MSIDSKLVNAVALNSIPKIIIAEYEIDEVPADSTCSDVFKLVLPAVSSHEYKKIPNLSVTGKAYAVQITGISISCESTKFDFSILNKDDMNCLNTINEVIKYVNCNLSMSDQDFDRFIVMNKDSLLTNALYLFLNNRSDTSTGKIRLELSYIPLHSDMSLICD